MKYLAAYALCVLGGNSSPDAAALKKVLESVGVTAEEDKLADVLGRLAGK